MPTYKAENPVGLAHLQKQMDENAAKGWELFVVTETSGLYTAIWKIPLEKEPRRLGALGGR